MASIKDEDIDKRQDVLLSDAELRLVKAAHAARLFDYRIPAAELKAMCKAKVDSLSPAKRSAYKKAKLQKAARKSSDRRDLTRQKILLGSYLIARLAKFPADEATLLAGIDAYIANDEREGARAKNATLVTRLREGDAPSEGRDSTMLKTVLGAYLMVLDSELPDARDTTLMGLEAFLRSDPRPWAVSRDLELMRPFLH